MSYQPIVGLEIHVELSTKSKMFCQCDASWQKYDQNTNTCPVCLGLPGALPVPNRKAIQYAIKIAQAFGCTINKQSHFDRKHYFYPDLAKGYQISQYDEPIGINGLLKFRVFSQTGLTSAKTKSSSMIEKSARIHRVHIEEDTGKLNHIGNDSVVDFNRSGVPLVEIVTEADFRNSDDVKAFLHELHTIITYLDVSDADMEKGSMRLEPNISVKEVPNSESNVLSNDLPKYKVEVKNINSFNFVKRAIDYEVKRQIEILKRAEIPAQETRGWDNAKQQTYSQRSKEEAHDYRYFPEPDIPPMEFDSDYIASILQSIPELPGSKVERYIKDFKLKESDAIALTRDKKLAEYFEQIITIFQTDSLKLSFSIDNIYQLIANLLINKRLSTDLPQTEFAKQVVELSKPKATDSNQLSIAIEKIINANNKSVADYKSGKVNALMFLLGQVMKEMKGQANAQTIRTELEKKLT